MLRAQLRIKSDAVCARISGELADSYALAEGAHAAGLYTEDEVRSIIKTLDEAATAEGDDIAITQGQVRMNRKTRRWHVDMRFTPQRKWKKMDERLAAIALEVAEMFALLGLEVDETHL